MERQIIQVPFTRLDAEKRMVYGYASTGRVDTYDTIFEPSWWPQAVIGYKSTRTLSAMHEDVNGESMAWSGREPGIVGTVPILEVDEKGLWVGAEVREQRTWERIVNGEYNGFSIGALPFEYREEEVDGRMVIRFTKYLLQDITVGYPAANLDARFQLVERLAMDADSPWDWDWTTDSDAIIAQLGLDGLAKACLYQDPEKDPKTKEAYRLPVMKLKEGALALYWNGVRAAMARILGGGGPMDIPEDERKRIYRNLVKLYKKFDKEPPEFRLGVTDGGSVMKSILEVVRGNIMRLFGKELDAQAVREIQEAETRLTGDRDQQMKTLTDTVAALSQRLELLEKPGTPAAGETTPEIEALNGTIAKLQERLDAVEKTAGKSQQPGEGAGGGERPKGDMNAFIRLSTGRK